MSEVVTVRTDAGPPEIGVGGVFARFLKFGLLAWGGPTAQIAMIREELVDREKWITPERFARVLGVYQALPGPEAHELCCYFGMVARGRLGAVAAGLGFMLPGLVLMLAASWLYVRYGLSSSAAQGAFAWCRAAVVALMVVGCVRLWRRTIGGKGVRVLGAVALAAGLGQWLGGAFWIGLIGGGAVAAAAMRGRWRWTAVLGLAWVAAMGWSVQIAREADSTREAWVERTVDGSGGGSPHGGEGAGVIRIAGAGLEAGLVTFGGAYTAIPVVEARAVRSNPGAWLSREEFLDTLAVGGVLPAPLIIFCTMVGYLGGGLAGAMVMTAGVFLPAFSFTLIGHRVFERVVDEPRTHAALEGVTAAAVGIMAATTARIALATIGAGERGAVTAAVFIAAAGVLVMWRSKWAAPCVVIGAAMGGIIG